jgi:hypothetical protein
MQRQTSSYGLRHDLLGCEFQSEKVSAVRAHPLPVFRRLWARNLNPSSGHAECRVRASVKQVLVPTIDTNQLPASTCCVANTPAPSNRPRPRRRNLEGVAHEDVIFSQAAVRFRVGPPWRNKQGKASPLAWFALRGARGKPESGPPCKQPLTSKLWF